jgi:hypothetical protein
MNIVDALKIGNKISEADAAAVNPANVQAVQPPVDGGIDAAVQKMSQGIQASVTEAIKPVLDEIKKLQTGIENLVNGSKPAAGNGEKTATTTEAAATPTTNTENTNKQQQESALFHILMNKMREAAE